MKENNLVKQTISSVPYRENECCYVFLWRKVTLHTNTQNLLSEKPQYASEPFDLTEFR